MTILIETDSTQTEVHPKGRTWELSEMYSHINCDIVQAVFLADGYILWVDEEGKLKDHVVNHVATALASRFIGPGDYIAGNAILTMPGEVD